MQSKNARSGVFLATLCVAMLFFLFSPLKSFSQVDQGGISGTIVDTTGAVIPNATVTITDTATGLVLSRQTDKGGFFVFTPIKIGNYTLEATAPGFANIRRENIKVDVSQRVAVNFKMKPGAATETVTVTSAPELQTEDASTGQVFSTKVINDTPLDGRNYVFIAQLATGVAAPNQGFRQVAGAGDFSSNGSRVSQNNFILDGVDNNSNMQDFLNGATYAVRPPPDALAEFKVESSDYSAELGRSTGAAVNASIKSGSNEMHGSLWEYFRSDRMAAIDYFNSGRTSYHQNQFGATLGGRFIKDKLFYFADAQGTRISSYVPAQPNNTVPTDAIRNGDFSEMLDPNNTNGNGSIPLYLLGGNPTSAPGAAEDPNVQQRYLGCNGAQNVICPTQVNTVAQNILKLFPKPNQGSPHQVFNNYTIPATSFTNNTTQYDVRVDYNPSQNDQAFGRYSYSNNPTNYTPPFGILDGGGFGSGGQNANYSKSGVISETHFFSPTLSNEFRVGYNWLHAAYLQVNSTQNIAAQLGLGGIPFGPNLGGMPDLSFGGFINSVGVSGYVPSVETQNVLQIIDNVSKVAGKHTLKVGVNLQHIRFYGLQPPNGLGSENFSGVYTSDPGNPNIISGSGVADFMLDQMNSSSITSITPITNLRWYEAAYVQDDWRVNSRLILNLGLRWEYAQPFVEAFDHQANFVGNYAGLNQGSGTYLIPNSQKNYPIPPQLQSAFTADHITVQYVSNRSLVDLKKLNFAPRVGLSYMLDPKTVLRAGGGLFYGDLEDIGLGLNLGNNAPFNVNANFIPNPNVCQNINGAITCPTNGQTLETGFSQALNAPNGGLVNFANLPTIYAAEQSNKPAYTVAYNLNIQHSLTDSLSFTIGYQGNQSRHLRESYNANQYAGIVPRGANGQLYQSFHDFGVVMVGNSGVGRYDSLQAKIEKRYSGGLYFLAGYTWSHCLDDAFGPIGQSQDGGYRNPNYLGLRYDYGACTQDVRNRFTFSPQYELPFGVGHKFLNRPGIANAVAGGWKTSFIFQVQTGTPIFLNSSNQGASYPIRVSDPFSPGGSPDPVTQPHEVCATKTRTLESWYNPCAYKNPPQAYNGPDDPAHNLIDITHAGTIPFGPPGRVSVNGPGFNGLDMSLFKDFAIPLRESALQFRADVFNVLNHPSFGNPNNGLQGANASSITSTRFSALEPNARVIQVAMKYSF
ncbi:TonB-dependent receptor domain-containing protein [Acidipila rosea]|uniref:Carboxypeptidase family protein n=1 Tax=Acidipila rosea TaxID=768535 RepID=A0A4R1KZD3_9BACT|nr:TonB-dependent receptor [Acidipila rosea]TCK70864.1 carboxypeptidase family protein [Acidipila rosea]